MKRLILLLILAVTVFIGYQTCNNKPNEPETTPETAPAAIPVKKILEEPMVINALQYLPEKSCLGSLAHEDSTDVTMFIFDTCSQKVSIFYTTLVGEYLSIDRKCDFGRNLTLTFSYENNSLTVVGSKISSPKDTTFLDYRQISDIIGNRYRID